MISEIHLRSFRCFSEARVRLHPTMNLMIGLNAQGKTSFLEAICVALRLQSPRTSQRSQWIKFGETHALVELALQEQHLRLVQGNGVRKMALNQEPVKKAQEYLQNSELVVWMDYSDMQLLRGGGEYRRRFMDFACAQLYPWYATSLKAYERALRNRNFLLKRDARIAWKEVDAYGEVLSMHAQVLSSCRAEFIQDLQIPFDEAHDALSRTQSHAEVFYRRGYSMPNLNEELQSRREDEAKNRTTCVGAHRDELELKLAGLEASVYASEGQQRTLSLSLKLGQAKVLEHKRGRPPILLMDDVFGELDPQRRLALLGFLSAGTQKVIATTSLDWALDLPESSLVYRVEKGQVFES